ncbi:MAG: hypothetical protein JSV66_18460 [Trueperaceae bacterium]|nr:MAG: hypothetical protein JSV66_18460 [Trueperaceae bacterium]
MKRFWLVFALAVPVLILTGCGINFFNGPSVSFSTVPGALGYSISSSGVITVGERVLTFRNRAGAMGVTLTGYTIEFFNENGAPVDAIESAAGIDNVSRGSLNLFVPPGIDCTSPDLDLGCTVNSAGATFVEGPVVSTQGYQLLPDGIVLAHLEHCTIEDQNADGFSGLVCPTGWYGEITFTGVSTTGRGYVSGPHILAIAPPN